MAAEGFANSGGVRVHYLDTGDDLALTPVVFVPGMLGAAEDYRTEMAALAPRRCLAISLRGRGRSDAPDTGYAFDDHVSDIEAVIAVTEPRAFCLSAYSRSVPYAIAYAFRHRQRLAGLILGDYPARYPAVPLAWVDHVLPHFSNRVQPRVIRALQRESTDVSLWDALPGIDCPILILRGGQPDSHLSADDVSAYQSRLSHADIVTFDEAGHELWQPDPDRYLRTLHTFLARLDA